ncbi:alpha/beta hydrolase [Saccharibacillus alkalitolerans]|uniref:BCE-2095-like N-terminal domain-containing protein n=1 Tax=Saccharibacillus alkalitolerans TaxID=2705290 RepID=A0ABX0FBM8_9BACL|nr:hypothetical protein [Saccharibacillus alkalitolerans]NGZ77810.1 hypothetical protein [Saccharibacillus alkalitolerans]
MKKMTATRLFNEALDRRERYGAEDAYAFAHAYVDRGDARQVNVLYALASASGRTAEAFSLLHEAVTERGFWYPSDYLLEDEDLEALRSFEGFAELADLCARREEAALSNAVPGLEVLKPTEPAVSSSGDGTSVSSKRLLLVLHGDQESGSDARPFWESALQAGWTVGLVRSSQIRFSDAFGWDDIDLGAAELREHLESLRAQEESQEDVPVVLGAFSAGAEVALNAVLHDEFPAAGLLLVSPWLAEPEEWTTSLDRLDGRTPRGVLIAGEADEEGRGSAEPLAQAMQSAGLECRLDIVSGTGHDYPEDFERRLNEALEWIVPAER